MSPLCRLERPTPGTPQPGPIATITEHFAAPIGDRLTTYGAYNAAGDPTTETDPSGQVWTLAYDSNGNLSTRTKVA